MPTKAELQQQLDLLQETLRVMLAERSEASEQGALIAETLNARFDRLEALLRQSESAAADDFALQLRPLTQEATAQLRWQAEQNAEGEAAPCEETWDAPEAPAERANAVAWIKEAISRLKARLAPAPLEEAVDSEFEDDDVFDEEFHEAFDEALDESAPAEAPLWRTRPVLLLGGAGACAGLFLAWSIAHQAPIPALPSASKVAAKTAARTEAHPLFGTYVARGGEPLDGLDYRFHLKLGTMRLANELRQGTAIAKGQRLLIPPVTGAFFNSRGESLAQMAARFNLKAQAIAELNPGLNAERIPEQVRVFVPGPEAIRVKYVQLSSPQAAPGRARNFRVASRSLTGHFGARIGRMIMPVQGALSSPFGYRDKEFHKGIDVVSPFGSPILATKEGTVVYAGWRGGYGYAVDVDHGGGIVTRYAHCNRLLVQAGDRVSAGQTIAHVGTTGHSTAPHLHLEVRVNGRPVDPTKAVL